MVNTVSALPRFNGLSGAAPGGLSIIERIVVYTGVFLVPFANLRQPQVFFTLRDLFFCLWRRCSRPFLQAKYHLDRFG